MKTVEKKKWYKKWWVWAIAALIIFIIIPGGDDENEQATDKTDREKIVEKEEEQNKELTEKEEPPAEKDSITKAESQKIYAYSTDMADHSKRFAECMNDFSRTFSAADYSDEWIMNTAVILVEMDNLTNEIINYPQENGPAVFSRVHNLHVQGMKTYKYIANELPAAIDNFDAKRINELTVVFDEANGLMNQATLKIQEINKTLS